MPPAGAGPFNVNVPTVLCPPETVFGLRVTEVGMGARTTMVFETVTPFAVARTVFVVSIATGTVLTVKTALYLPAAAFTVAGTVTADPITDMAIVKPVCGAGPFR